MDEQGKSPSKETYKHLSFVLRIYISSKASKERGEDTHSI
jgi:hypothetical protein